MSATLICVGHGGATTQAPLESYLTPALRDAARTETNQWIKRLRTVPYGTQSMRDRFTYRGDSLWWFTELYLQKMRQLDAAVATVLALEEAQRRHSPARLTLRDATAPEVTAARAFGTHHNVAVEATTSARRQPSELAGYLVGLTAKLSRLRYAGAHPVAGRSPIAAFIHTAFWSSAGDPDDPQQEQYIGPILDALVSQTGSGDVAYVGVGPRRNFRARRWWDPLTRPTGRRPPITAIERLASRQALEGSLALWRGRQDLARAVTAGDAVRDAAKFRQCDLWPLLERELADAALVQWPWSARAMDEAGAALDALAPSVTVTYAEAGGWGRALTLEARRRRIQSVGLQHGFIYRHWLNYLHDADEFDVHGDDRGCPIPDRTLLFDRYAEEHLMREGHYPAGRLEVTGNARLDALSARIQRVTPDERTRLRAALGLGTRTKLLVLAAKHREIHDLMPALVDAVAALPDAHLAIRPHPAETPDVYAAAIGGRANISVASSAVDLGGALAAADGLVTMNSTVAIDGLSLGVPAAVIGLPNNLSPFVTAGVMLGADAPEKIKPMLESLLYDRTVRQDLAKAADTFVDRYGLRPSGDGAARTAAEIVALTRAGRPGRRSEEGRA